MMRTPNPASARWQALARQLQPLQARFQALDEREQLLLKLGAAAIGLLLVWLVAVQPAWRTLRQAPARLEQLELQLQDMQGLAQEARELRATPPVAPAQATQALQAASSHLGAGARLSISGDRAMLTLSGVDSAALQAWLGEVRNAARARVISAQLQRGPQGFSGTLVLALSGVPAP
ncbi:type II secretion system protein GspM [Roseateles violae]|uniref:Type II secretion system protein GspM n=1 Tax=Roseateles violae TaxID=3058042 RepID=A0ABT8DT38_9BURK|nr:type II secretion system protein GspM [Pelomonas sp. PFR6]MDN3921153.1 type II secretion system protein GspM [Pelomonas sp. PFR6]